MNTKDQLYQAKREQELSFQQIAKLIPSMTTPQVKAVFEDAEPDQRHLETVCNALGVNHERGTTKAKLEAIKQPPNTETKKAKIADLREKIEKVGKRDKATLDMAKGEACVDCSIEDGTTCSCHYNGIMQHSLGQCLSEKVDDDYTMFLCYTCHTKTDQKKFTKGIATEFEKLEDSHRQAFLIIKTMKVKVRKYKERIAELERLVKQLRKGEL